ncbi:MAG TPA: hypothetical protein VH369_22330 [Bryobacteraceae bacterium]|jgi:hypothetical protein
MANTQAVDDWETVSAPAAKATASDWETVSAPPSATARYTSNLLASLNPFPALKRYLWDLPQAQQQDIAAKLQSGDYSGAVKTAAASLPGVSFANDALRAQIEQARQSAQSARQGDYSEAFGHGLAAVLPLAGPAAAKVGEQIGSGDVAGGLGAATGLVAPFAAKPVIGAAGKLVPSGAGAKVAEVLNASAEKNWAKAINPTTKANKAIVQDVVAPGLVQRKVVATSLDDLKSGALANMEKYGQQIDDFIDAHGSEGMPSKPILDSIDALRSDKSRAGVTPSVNKPYVQTLDDLRKDVEDLAAAHGGTLTLEDVRWLRQQYDVPAAAKNAFALPPAEGSKIAAITDVTNRIRGHIADTYPELAEANKEFSFWNKTHDVADATLIRSQGQKPPLTKTVAEAVGAGVGAHGGFGTAYAASKAAGILARFQNSALWNSLSAQTKSQLADLAASGDIPGMFRLAAASGAGLSPRSVPPPSATAQQ